MSDKKRMCKNCKYWRQSNIFRQGGTCSKLTELVSNFTTFTTNTAEEEKDFDLRAYIAVETRSTSSCLLSEKKARKKN